jgi:hypothetical protein
MIMDELKSELKTDVNALNPSAKQVESIEFIIKNQKNIVDSIYDYYNKVLSPVYIIMKLKKMT